MSGYIAAFSVYTMAMIGVIFVAFLVWKHAILNRKHNPKSSLKVEEMLNLTSRKALYVIRAGNERYLIASDAERTTLIAKLQEDEQPFKAIEGYSEIQNEPLADIGINERKSAMRNILRELTRKDEL